jgi:ABC-type Fe3+-siderophore transport system permease subunit
VDLILAICQGVGLATAAGMLAGCLAYEGPERPFLIGLAAAAGAALFAASLTSGTDTRWPGIFVGAPIGAFAMLVTHSVVAGASQRAAASQTALSLTVAGAALVLALVALFISPLALLAVAAFVWLGASRRRREGRKHEGLRVLR